MNFNLSETTNPTPEVAKKMLEDYINGKVQTSGEFNFPKVDEIAYNVGFVCYTFTYLMKIAMGEVQKENPV